MKTYFMKENKDVYEAIVDFASEINKVERSKFSREIWQKCCDFGILGMLTPSNVGGLADNYKDLLEMARIIGYLFEDSGFVFAINNSLIVSAFLLPKFASKELNGLLYPQLFDGRKIAAYAITETESGSDSFNMRTTYEETEQNFIINGTKTYISNVGIADVYAVVAKNENNLSVFLIDKSDIGFSINYQIEKMGLEGCPMGQISFDKCEIPKTRLIGKLGEGMNITNQVLEWERTCSFASHLGTMERIMENCISYANIRRSFGKSIGSNQLISEKISKMKIKIELGKLLLEKIQDKRVQGRSTYMESSIFKYWIGESYSLVAMDAMQIYGAYGYSKEGKIESEVRDALASKIYSGTSEIQLDIIARMLGVKK